MKILAAILLVSFLGMILFGFLVMNNEMQGGAAQCLANLVQNGSCQNQSNLGIAAYHISAIKFFSTVVFPALTVSSLAIFAIVEFFLKKDLLGELIARISFLAETDFQLLDNLKKPKQKIVSWLSLFELSPAIA